jgi:hypothetical protein
MNVENESDEALVLAMCSGPSANEQKAQWELQRRYTERQTWAAEKQAQAAKVQAGWARAIGWFTLVLVLSSIAQVIVTYLKD